jgi:hypothetical protein
MSQALPAVEAEAAVLQLTVVGGCLARPMTCVPAASTAVISTVRSVVGINPCA